MHFYATQAGADISWKMLEFLHFHEIMWNSPNFTKFHGIWWISWNFTILGGKTHFGRPGWECFVFPIEINGFRGHFTWNHQILVISPNSGDSGRFPPISRFRVKIAFFRQADGTISSSWFITNVMWFLFSSVNQWSSSVSWFAQNNRCMWHGSAARELIGVPRTL